MKNLRIIFDTTTLEIIAVIDATDGTTILPDNSYGVLQITFEDTLPTQQDTRDDVKNRISTIIQNVDWSEI